VIPLYDMGVKKAKPTFRLLLFQLLSSLQKSFQLSNEIFLYFRWNPNCYRSEMGNSCISRLTCGAATINVNKIKRHLYAAQA